MKTLRKYLLSAFAAIVLSLTLANATAMAYCPEVYEANEYTCYSSGEDESYCYYECYCHAEQEDCEAALVRDGFEILREE